MPSHPHPLEPPGEDTFDLPAGLTWFVAVCTWLRRHLREGSGGNPIALSVSTARIVLAMSLK